jgi:AraC-like DNA-binding protein
LYLKSGGQLPDVGLQLDTYVDVLAPTPMRAMQNGLICLISVVCRIAIENGVEERFSFALSDYYTYEVELCNSKAELQYLVNEIMETYSEVVREKPVHSNALSLPVIRAVRYIHQHIAEPCRVKDIAQSLGLHPNYMSAMFKKEMGMSPTQYIREKKMEEATFLLRHSDYTVAQVGEMLGYCNTAYFSNEFKRVIGKTPNSHRQSQKK